MPLPRSRCTSGWWSPTGCPRRCYVRGAAPCCGSGSGTPPKDVEQRGEQVRRFVAELKTMPIAVNTADAIEQHYEVDTRFYDLCLGPRKKYSSCYWGPETKTLAEAENLMFEHMKNYQKLMGRCASWLRPGGKMFIHIFTHRDYPYHFETGVDYDWMARKFFTGGTMPSDDLLLYFNDHFTIADHWKVNGVHYSKTLEAWLNLMDKNIVEVRKVFAECYGAENVTEWVANWRLFFIACSELFRFDGGNEWIVSGC